MEKKGGKGEMKRWRDISEVKERRQSREREKKKGISWMISTAWLGLACVGPNEGRK